LSLERAQEVTPLVSGTQAHAAEPEPPTVSERPWHKPGFEVVDYSITQTGFPRSGTDISSYS
jgi:hypothetical protein